MSSRAPPRTCRLSGRNRSGACTCSPERSTHVASPIARWHVVRPRFSAWARALSRIWNAASRARSREASSRTSEESRVEPRLANRWASPCGCEFVRSRNAPERMSVRKSWSPASDARAVRHVARDSSIRSSRLASVTSTRERAPCRSVTSSSSSNAAGVNTCAPVSSTLLSVYSCISSRVSYGSRISSVGSSAACEPPSFFAFSASLASRAPSALADRPTHA